MNSYDVFISCKSKDYRYAEEIYDYLKNHGINVFLASRELRRLGESEYRRAISKALREAYHLIVFASNPEFIESTWVEYEWDMFVNAKLKGKKQGNILTILKDVSTDSIPMDLWKYESFKFEDYKENLIKYVETPDSRERRKELERREEEERKKKLEEETKERKRSELKQKVEASAKDYKRSVAALQVDIDKINSLLKELDIVHRECPICHNAVPVDEMVCNVCGWSVSPLDGLPELSYLIGSIDHQKEVFASIYNTYVRLKQNHNSSVYLEEQKLALENELKLKEEELSRIKEKAIQDYKEICKAKVEIEKLNDVCKRKEEDLFLKTKYNEKLKEDIDKYENGMVSMQKDLQKQQLELEKRQTIIEELNKKIHQLDSSQKKSNSKSCAPEYSVWVVFCPVGADSIISEYNKAFIFDTLATYLKRDSPIFVASFSSFREAEALKARLEKKGASVEIRQGKQIVVPRHLRSDGNPRKNDPSPSFQHSDKQKYGVRISNYGNNKNKVAQIMAGYFNRSVSSFNSALQSLPYYSPNSLTKDKAEELLSSLQKLGVYCALVHLT